MRRRWFWAALLCAQAAWGAEWRHAHSAHFEIYTDSSKARATQLLRRMELARQHFQSWGTPPLPVRVVLFSDERQFAPLRTAASTKGFFQAGADRDYIVLLDAGDGTLRGAVHEYAHLVLHHSAGPLPRWQEEGIAEFHSTLRADGEIVTGEPVAGHVAMLRAEGVLDAARMAAAARGDISALPGRAVPLFYAQSWALIHLIQARGGGDTRHVMPPFDPIEEAELGPLIAELPQYVRRPAPGWKTGRKPDPPAAVEEETIPEARALLVLADLALRVGSVKYARALLTGAEAARPDDPGVLHETGLLALAGGDEAGARVRFEKAAQSPLARGQTFFELALLERERLGVNAPRVRELLEEAVRRTPNHAEAYFLLGQMEESQGRPARAIEWLEKAVSVLPRQSRMWYALALARHQEGLVVAGQKAAATAVATAGNRLDRERAEALVEELRGSQSAVPPTATPRRPAAAAPEAWNQLRGKEAVEGELRELVCGRGAEPLLRIWNGSALKELVLERGTRATGKEVELRCGAQTPPVPVEVSYDPATRRAVSVDFR